jgi:hypothetical protein
MAAGDEPISVRDVAGTGGTVPPELRIARLIRREHGLHRIADPRIGSAAPRIGRDVYQLRDTVQVISPTAHTESWKTRKQTASGLAE